MYGLSWLHTGSYLPSQQRLPVQQRLCNIEPATHRPHVKPGSSTQRPGLRAADPSPGGSTNGALTRSRCRRACAGGTQGYSGGTHRACTHKRRTHQKPLSTGVCRSAIGLAGSEAKACRVVETARQTAGAVKETHTQTNKQTNNQTNKQTIKQTNKRAAAIPPEGTAAAAAAAARRRAHGYR